MIIGITCEIVAIGVKLLLIGSSMFSTCLTHSSRLSF